ncbi:CoA transferase [Streptomyces mirabilis]|uniref:CoA transferase n=1 Tax=Streptomyces mirabilis TaxID=68239 RepID=UPI0036C935F0
MTAADLTAYDDTIQAECGLPFAQQQLTGQVGYVGTIMADKVAGMTALYATMMALFHRERTGEGQEVEVGMIETMAAFMLVEHANGAMFSPPLGSAAYPRAVAPNRKPYRTKDGHLSALVYNDKQWSAFVNAVRPTWAGEVDTWGGWIWINMDPECEPLRDYLEPAATLLEGRPSGSRRRPSR